MIYPPSGGVQQPRPILQAVTLRRGQAVSRASVISHRLSIFSQGFVLEKTLIEHCLLWYLFFRSSSAPRPSRGGISTLKDIASAPSPAGDMSEDDDDDDRDKGPDLYAGGGKSGLNVQDPAQQNGGKAAGIVADILKKAKEYVLSASSNYFCS